jgi:threonine dehydrogenase-like Zn-dependent dehydrogenase
MKALRYSEEAGVRVADVPIPVPGPKEALIRVLRAGICSTDTQILKGYVPGFDNTLGHEFVGVVAECPCDPGLVGQRVVGEINCREVPCEHKDPIFVRNHAPGRTVLGIIGRDGTLAEFCTLPAENLYVVPDQLTDREACFAEPLAAACRIVEQQARRPRPPALLPAAPTGTARPPASPPSPLSPAAGRAGRQHGCHRRWQAGPVGGAAAGRAWLQGVAIWTPPP